MEQVKSSSSNVTAIVDKTNKRTTKDYQKYFDVSSSAASAQACVKAKTKYSRAHAVLICAYIVLGLLLSLFIMNFIIINSLSVNIQYSQSAIANEQIASEQYLGQIAQITGSSAVQEKVEQAGYVEGATSTEIIFTDMQTREEEQIPEQTNWFNELTSFISQFFGG